MADNYLERKFEEMRNPAKPKTIIRQVGKSLDTLLTQNRSCRGYDPSVIISQELLQRIVAVNTKLASAKNQQCLRFKLVTRENGAEQVTEHIKLGALLPDLHLPFPGTEPPAYIIVCSTVPENKMVDIDLGISVQSMLLKAVELGLNGVIIGAFNKQKITELFQLPYEPLLLVAVGKGIERFQLKEIGEAECHHYYREEGIQMVPKVRVEDLFI